ncbi:MAG: hypothetical protein JWO58_3059 [Chitinophagaceae bacterium]|nr:hypothetical protein [Chitinophagaceae bacterium]
MREEGGVKSGGLTFEKCREILNKGKRKYIDQEIEMIRQFLYQIAEIDYQIYQNIKKREREEKQAKLN